MQAETEIKLYQNLSTQVGADTAKVLMNCIHEAVRAEVHSAQYNAASRSELATAAHQSQMKIFDAKFDLYRWTTYLFLIQLILTVIIVFAALKK